MITNLLNKKVMSKSYFDYQIYRFSTNCKEFTLTFEVNKKIYGNYPHVGVTAREGICVLYKYPDKDIWYNLDTYARRNPALVRMSNHGIEKHIFDENSEYEIMIIGPLFGELSKLTIEHSDKCYVKLNDKISERTMLFAGGSHSFGIGCTTVGLKYSNILTREAKASKIDLTFNNRKDSLKTIYEYYTNHKDIPIVDVGILEVDCLVQNSATIESYLEKIIELMKKHCKHIICWYCLPDDKNNKKQLISKILEKDIENNIVQLLDMSFIYDDEYLDMCTLSNNFINDTANIFIYKKLKEAIKGVTKWNI